MAGWSRCQVHATIRSACAMLAAGVLLCAAAPSLAQAGDDPATPRHDRAAAAAHQPIPETQRPLGFSSTGPSGDGRSSNATDGAPAGGRGWAVNTGLSLAGVLGVIFAVAALVRAAAKGQTGLRAALGPGGRAPAGVLEVLGRYPVARGSTLVLLKLDRRVLLLSQSSAGRIGAGASFNTLCEITDPEEVASILVRTRDAESESMSERFRTMLTAFDRSMADAQGDGEPGRRVSGAPGGDRVELWDDRSGIPVVDLTRRPGDGIPAVLASIPGRIGAMFGRAGGGTKP